MPDTFDERFSGLPVDAPSTSLVSDIVGNAQIASPQFNLVPVDYDPFPKRRKGPAAFNDEPPSEMIRPDAPVADKMFGLNGKERYQFFPERLARSVYDIMSGQVAPYNPSTGEYNVEGAMDVAGLLGGAPLGIKPGTASLGSGAARRNANEFKMTAVEHNPFDKKEYPLAPRSEWYGEANYDKTGGKMQMMTPDDFLSQAKPLKIDEVSRENIDILKKHIEDGKTLDPLQLYKNGKEDGRHRAIAAKELGIEQVPVISFRSDTQKPGLAIAGLKEPAKPFYSAVEKAVTDIQQPKMTGQQWLGTLSNKPGVKPEELDWIGLKDYLKENADKVVTKQEIENHVAANKVELKDVDKGDIRPTRHTVSSAGGHSETYEGPLKFDTLEEAQAELERRQVNNPTGYHNIAELPDIETKTKYQSYQLPGGENYREKLLTLPVKAGAFDPSKVSYKKIREYADNNAYRLLYDDKEIGTFTDYKDNPRTPEEWTNVVRQRFGGNPSLGIKPLDKNNYQSSHWDEPNVLAHVRMNDRFIPDETALPAFKAYQKELRDKYGSSSTTEGTDINVINKATDAEIEKLQKLGQATNKKSLHIEEIQSDWHQQGRQQGYAKPPEPQYTVVDQHGNQRGSFKNEKEAQDYLNNTPQLDKKLSKIKRVEDAISEGVPDAPFKKTWHELALKRMLREAAEKGYDRLSWTPGEAQAARYDLSKQVDSVWYNPETKLLQADKGGNNIISKVVEQKELPNVIGKEAADKILNNPTKKKKLSKEAASNDKELADLFNNVGDMTTGTWHVLEGVDLKIGGEGMKGFYDQIISKALEKIGKEHGVKVKQGSIEGKKTSAYQGPPHTIESLREIIGKINKSNEPVSTGNGIVDIIKEMKNGVKFEDAVDKHYSYNVAKALGGKEIIKPTKEPIHYIDIPQSLKDQAMHKGFPLFSGGFMLNPVDHDPFSKEKK